MNKKEVIEMSKKYSKNEQYQDAYKAGFQAVCNIKGIKAIVSYYNKVELLKEEIDKLKSIRESNTFIMTIFLAGENSVDNYTMSITSDNMMQNDYGVLYQDFIDKLIEGKEKELASYNMVLEKFSEKI